MVNSTFIKPVHIGENIIHDGDTHICEKCGNTCEVTVVDMLIVDKNRKPTGDTDRKEVYFCPTCNSEPNDYTLAFQSTHNKIYPLSAVAT